jgi:tRNA nucleotidyltransferase (CCA-adding enzyme)
MEQLTELLESKTPAALLASWHLSGKLRELLPEVNCLAGVGQNPEHHPEVDTLIHIGLCLEVAQKIGASKPAKFAVLLHDLGKGLTPLKELPRHVNHEIAGIAPVNAVCERFQVRPYWRTLALLVCEYHLKAHRAFEMRSKSMLSLLSELNLETDTRLLDDFVIACESDKRGRLGLSERPYPQGAYIRDAAKALEGLWMERGTVIQDREQQVLHNLRLNAVRNAGKPYRQAIEDAKASKNPS